MLSISINIIIINILQKNEKKKKNRIILVSCRTATLDFFFDLAESKVAVFLFCFGKNSFL